MLMFLTGCCDAYTQRNDQVMPKMKRAAYDPQLKLIAITLTRVTNAQRQELTISSRKILREKIGVENELQVWLGQDVWRLMA